MSITAKNALNFIPNDLYMFWLALAGLFFRSKSKKYSVAVDQLISIPFAFMRLTAIRKKKKKTHLSFRIAISTISPQSARVGWEH